MSKRLGLGVNTWGHLEKGVNIPSGDTLLRLSILDFSPNWILTGLGSMRMDDVSALPKSHRIKIETELMARIVDAIASLQAQQGAELEPMEIGRLAGETYEDIWNMSGPMIKDVAEHMPADYERYLDSLISLVLIESRRDLRMTRATPAKRSA